jgi:hypothetical protein
MMFELSLPPIFVLINNRLFHFLLHRQFNPKLQDRVQIIANWWVSDHSGGCRSLLGDAGLHVVGAEAGASLDMHNLQQVLSDKMHLDADAAASFVAGLRLYMDDDPYKVGSCPFEWEAQRCSLDTLLNCI